MCPFRQAWTLTNTQSFPSPTQRQNPNPRGYPSSFSSSANAACLARSSQTSTNRRLELPPTASHQRPRPGASISKITAWTPSSNWMPSSCGSSRHCHPSCRGRRRARLMVLARTKGPSSSLNGRCFMAGTTPSSWFPSGSKGVLLTSLVTDSFLHLRLMLHRPILTQLCAAESSAAGSPSDAAASTTPSQELFNSFAGGCARICLGAAMDLIELVHETYLTSATAGWWWDGLCRWSQPLLLSLLFANPLPVAFTAGLAIIVAYLFPALVASLDRGRLERCWMLCQTILAHFSSFSISAQRSLRLLQKVHSDVMSRSPGEIILFTVSLARWPPLTIQLQTRTKNCRCRFPPPRARRRTVTP